MDEALEALRQGRVVAAATESFFGLFADVARADAIERLLVLKPRSADKAMPVVLPSRAAWGSLVSGLSPLAERLANAFWPGPLSIALPAASDVDQRLTLQGRIAVRLPGPSAAAELVRGYGRPLTATSANPSGQPSPSRSTEVRAAFGGACRDLLYIVDGIAPGGAPSTVVVVDGADYRVVRPGRISAADLASAAALDPAQFKR